MIHMMIVLIGYCISNRNELNAHLVFANAQTITLRLINDLYMILKHYYECNNVLTFM